MRRHQSVRAAILTIGLLSSPTLAQAELSESPIAPGEIAADKDTLGEPTWPLPVAERLGRNGLQPLNRLCKRGCC